MEDCSSKNVTDFIKWSRHYFPQTLPLPLKQTAQQKRMSHFFQLAVNREWTMNSTCPFSEDTGHSLRLSAIKNTQIFPAESNVMIIDLTIKRLFF